MRLGVFGGSFDPVHRGHIALAFAATSQLSLDTLLWVPAGSAWQKAGHRTAGEHRAAMVRAALQDTLARTRDDPVQHAWAARWQLDERELKRAGPSYTIDTIEALHVEHPQATLWLVIGQDQWANLATWHRHEALLAQVRLAVVARNGQTPVPTPSLAVQAPIHVLDMPAVPAASTLIRQRLRDGLPTQAWLPEPVARYIEAHGLYGRPQGCASRHDSSPL
jgi:nicotinate-nucleotide adenylyltransferase